jgi:predicted TIM-barrel fold metal-dependent hydrolase
VTGTVIVEASEWIEDNQWLLDLAKDDPWIVGIVGRLDPSVAKFEEQLRRFAANPLYRGIRIWEDRLRDLLSRNELGSFKLMADLGITADVNGSPDVLDLAAELSKRVSGLTIALNHIGNVAITDAAPPESWKKSIVAASTSSNVYCKISALAEGAGREGRKAPDDLEFYRPTLDVVWNAFGADRVIYGSNWPVCEVAADYQKVQRLSMDYVSEKGEDSLRKFCSENSVNAYRWTVR